MNNMSEYAVKVENLSSAYDSRPVLSDINLEIQRGKLTAIMGPNGAGKTTLIKAMTGLIKTVNGKITFNKINGRKPVIGYVPQSESIDPDFPVSVLDVVTMGCYGRLGWIKRPKYEDKCLALEMLEKTGIKELADRQISCLSGGQQQRAFIARALVQKADIYFMDEPFKGVDKATEKSIIELLKELRNDGRTIIVVHHDILTAKEYFDNVVLINISVVASGEANRVFTDENLSRTYFGGEEKRFL